MQTFRWRSVGDGLDLRYELKAVREGQTRRAPMGRVADTLTGYFVPFVTLIAITTWIFWLALGTAGTLPEDYLGQDLGGWVAWSLQFAIAVFVVACPCGLALAAPTALFVGGGLAAQYGILVKGGGEAFEKASKLDCVVFDKTGTLTMGGEPVVTDVQTLPFDAGTAKDTSHLEMIILGMVNALEEHSCHTVAKALTSFCKNKDAKDVDVTSVEEIAGKGKKGKRRKGKGKKGTEVSKEVSKQEEERKVQRRKAKKRLDYWKRLGEPLRRMVERFGSGILVRLLPT